MAKWYDDLTLVKGLGEALTNAEYLEDSTEFNAYLKTPQKFNAVYDVWEAAGFPTSDSDDGWDNFVEGISESDDDDDGEGSDDGDET